MTDGPTSRTSRTDRPASTALTGLRVVEMGVWVAAPSAGALLADWGADVIKVEPPNGDPMRSAFGSLGIGQDFPNPAFAQDNRGKRSVVLDLRQPEARERLEELLSTADVFLTNLRPDALDGLDLEPAATVARHPRLVYCSVSGYGLRGEDRNRPAYDIGAFWARSGLSVQLANSDGVPLNARGGIGDHISGLAALAGLGGSGRGARAAPDRARACRRGLPAADRDVRARVGPQPAGDRRQGGEVRGAALQPDAADELLPDQGRPLVLLHGARGGPPHRPRAACAGPDGPARRPPLRRRQGAPQEPHRGDRRARRHRRRADARRVGRAPRRRGRLVGTGPGAGRRARRPPARRQRRVPPTPRRHRRDDAPIHQRPGELLRPARRPGGAGAVPRRAHRGGPGRARGRAGARAERPVRPDRGPGPAGPGR